MKKLGLLLFFALTFCGFQTQAQMASVYQRPAAPQQKPSPEDWLTKKGKELLDILQIHVTKKRYLELGKIAKEVTNPKEMARLSMGKYWKNLTKEQQTQLQDIFIDYFVVAYGTVRFNLGDVSIRVFEKIPSGKDVLLKVKVNTKFKKEDLNDIPKRHRDDIPETAEIVEIIFAVRETETGYYIRDAKFEGQSVVMFLRASLEKKYDEVAYDGDALIKSMRKKINDQYAAAEKSAQMQQDRENQKKEGKSSNFGGKT